MIPKKLDKTPVSKSCGAPNLRFVFYIESSPWKLRTLMIYYFVADFKLLTITCCEIKNMKTGNVAYFGTLSTSWSAIRSTDARNDICFCRLSAEI